MHTAEKEAESGYYYFSGDGVARYINIGTRPPQTCLINESGNIGLITPGRILFGVIFFTKYVCGVARAWWNDS